MAEIIKYKITNKHRTDTMVRLEDNESVLVKQDGDLVVNSKPINVTTGLTIEEIKEEIKQVKTKPIKVEVSKTMED